MACAGKSNTDSTVDDTEILTLLKVITLLTALTTVIVDTTKAQHLTFTAIPDQLETTLIARADAVTNLLENYISEKCNVDVNVVYNPVTNYQDAVDALLDNSADFGWYGGLTGVQAGLRSSPAVYLTQRIEDTQVSTCLMHNDKIIQDIMKELNRLYVEDMKEYEKEANKKEESQKRSNLLHMMRSNSSK